MKKTKVVAKPHPLTEKELEKNLQKIGSRIRELRIKKGYSSYEIFAFENNINRAQFGRYERGADLRISSLLRILKALDVTPEEFFREVF